MAGISGMHPAVSAMLDALGLPPGRVLSFTLSAEAYKPVEVRVQMYAEVDHVERLTAVVRKYNLVLAPVDEVDPQGG